MLNNCTHQLQTQYTSTYTPVSHATKPNASTLQPTFYVIYIEVHQKFGDHSDHSSTVVHVTLCSSSVVRWYLDCSVSGGLCSKKYTKSLISTGTNVICSTYVVRPQCDCGERTLSELCALRGQYDSS